MVCRRPSAQQVLHGGLLLLWSFDHDWKVVQKRRNHQGHRAIPSLREPADLKHYQRVKHSVLIGEQP